MRLVRFDAFWVAFLLASLPQHWWCVNTGASPSVRPLGHMLKTLGGSHTSTVVFIV